MNNKWFKPIRVNKEAKVDLICFPYAGSGASIFYPWEKYLDPKINLYAFQAPGREDRIGEDLINELDELTHQGAKELLKITHRPFIFFGHSLGAVIAFEITKILEKSATNPLMLIVSGRQPPHLSLKMPPLSGLSDAELLEGLMNLQGTDPEILEHPALLEIILPIIRGDFKIGENYFAPINGQKILCPIIAVGALNDPWVDLNQIIEWKNFTLNTFAAQTVAGDHFYVKNDFEELVHFLNQKILQV
jgi:medium-chain acyl-[acyl-carrier-protein] hydrolase